MNFPSHEITTFGSKTESIRVDFFLLSDQECSIPYQLGLREKETTSVFLIAVSSHNAT